MKSTANRFGKAALDGVAAAKADKESSHGRHIVTPTPRSTVRRSTRAISSPASDVSAPTLILSLSTSLRALRYGGPPSLQRRRKDEPFGSGFDTPVPSEPLILGPG